MDDDFAPSRFGPRHAAAVAVLLVSGVLVAWPVFLTGFLALVSLDDCFLDECNGPAPGTALLLGMICLGLVITPFLLAFAVIRGRWRWAVPPLLVAVPVTLWFGGLTGFWAAWT